MHLVELGVWFIFLTFKTYLVLNEHPLNEFTLSLT